MQAKQKIEELEARIRALEARQPTQVHYHYAQPSYAPYPQPWYPTTAPFHPIWNQWQGHGGVGAGVPQNTYYLGAAQ